MNYDIFYSFAGPLMDLLAVIAAVFSTLIFYEILKKKKKRDFLTTVFGLISITFITFAIAEVSWDIIELMGGVAALGIPEFFYIIGSLTAIGGFGYLSYYLYKAHGLGKKFTYTILFAALISLIIFYMTYFFILGNQEGESSFEIFLDYFYPISSALIVIFSFSAYFFFEKFKKFGNQILLLAVAFFAMFLADMLYTYYTWNEITGITAIMSDSLFILFYLIGALVMFKLYNNIRVKK